MFKKTQDTSLDALTSRRHAVVKPRLHKFPPLRKSWQQTAGEHGVHGEVMNPAALQEQLMQGFQDGLNRGFAQGMEEGKNEGYQEGSRLGFEEGMRKGLAEGSLLAKQQFLEAAQPLEGVRDELQKFLTAYEQRRREELLQLVDKVARQVIRCELALQPTQMLTLIEEAISSLPSVPEQIRIYMNSEEFKRISEAEPEKSRQWGLCADADLAAGECRVVTDTTEMDIGCQHRMDQCVDVLKETLLPEAHDE
ncbi:flagellar assembly protein FliH [Enterobacter sp. R1(2018)]|uniref:flagellar assembly protein FliH n=1 Tax=Enterobacter sp. R1(2018) TaxID=2447891 RepID=UPI000EB48649|nr:flagellar assembly protein FliH [Enterobacter sp. R1(2018)]RKQ41044.1 flagellar assembly protein H [Enterobacter sp. R1(2018)]